MYLLLVKCKPIRVGLRLMVAIMTVRTAGGIAIAGTAVRLRLSNAHIVAMFIIRIVLLLVPLAPHQCALASLVMRDT